MQSDAESVEEYIAGLPEERRAAISTVRDRINDAPARGIRRADGLGDDLVDRPARDRSRTPTTASRSATPPSPRRSTTWRST